MTCRPLLWITATAVALGAAAVPAPASAAPNPLFVVTIDETEELVTSRHIEILGEASYLLDMSAETVTVTVAPQPPLPPQCAAASGSGQVVERRYRVEVDVLCNGPYQVQVVAHARGLDSGDPETRDIAVAEAPGPPERPVLEEAPDGGLIVSWAPSADLDAAGWIVVANSTEYPLPDDTIRAALPPEQRQAATALRAVRWGAEGPGGPTVVSPESGWVLLVEQTPVTTPTDPQPTDPVPTDPPTTPPAGGAGPPTGGTPPPTSGDTGPSRGTGSTSTLPEGFSEEIPFGIPDDAFVPGEEPERSPDLDGHESAAVGSTPPAGLVRTTEKRSPGLVAPFALGLLMITVAAHIAWYLRRSRPSGPQQVTLG